MTKLSLESLFGDAYLDIDCPKCSYKFKVKFKQVMRDHSIVICPSCQEEIELVHDETTKKTLRDSSKALSDFEKTLKKFGK